MDIEKEIKWYIDAVRSDLILNYGLSTEDANAAMERYMLMEKMKEYPDVQLHYSISSVTREMQDLGCLTTNYDNITFQEREAKKEQ